MAGKIKKVFYFYIAGYFWVFAWLRLKIWHPTVIAITGSSGKTTLLHLIESQIGSRAKYSHEANSSFGIPFDILDIHRKDLVVSEWLLVFIKPLINIFKPIPKQKYYIVEADCDRPFEGVFLSKLLKPDITLWTNVARTHSMNFEQLIQTGKFKNLEEAIAFEFGYFAQETKELLITNGDNVFESAQAKRSKAKTVAVSLGDLTNYKIDNNKTIFQFEIEKYTFEFLLPEVFAYSLLMTKILIQHLGMSFDNEFKHFKLPPGRNSFFEGVKNTTLIDSSYNANLDSMKAVIEMFAEIKTNKKWVVLGDMLEQGTNEQAEHEKLAELIARYKYQKVILMGPRISKYTKPKLEKLTDAPIISFVYPKDTLDYILKNIKGGEVILFKGARFLEGVIENLLRNKNDINKLARREKIWEIRRKKWGLK